MIGKIDHIGIAVKNLGESLKLYTDILGLKVTEIEVLPDQKIRTAIITIGESKVELIESTASDGTITKFVEKRGEGLHHVALEVDNLEEALRKMKESHVPLIDEKPRRGVQNTRIAFIHPQATIFLLELVEKK